MQGSRIEADVGEHEHETQRQSVRDNLRLGLGLGSSASLGGSSRLRGPSLGPTLIGKLYRGYTISPTGSVIGLVWAFFDGLIGGAVFAGVYNRLASSDAFR